MNNVLKKVLFAAGIFVVAEAAMACTRVVYLGNNDVMTARSMDWKSDIGTNLWILPNNVKRNGMAGPKSIQWTSKYGSVVATGYDISTTDGVNEKGLMANLLWLVESEWTLTRRADCKAICMFSTARGLVSLTSALFKSALYIKGSIIHP